MKDAGGRMQDAVAIGSWQVAVGSFGLLVNW